MNDSPGLIRAAVFAAVTAVVAVLAVASSAVAQEGVVVPLPGGTTEGVREALARECYEAGMVAEMASDAVLDCSAVLEERSAGGAPRARDEASAVDDTVVVRHRLRFTLLGRGGSLVADAWTETQELGITVPEPIAGQEYLERVRSAVVSVAERLRTSGDAAPPWRDRYESEQAWHLDAHLRAVRHCDVNLASMDREALGAQLVSIGIRPLGDDTRDRCEQLYQHLFEWGLARGNDAPTVDAYARYRAALPPEQRTCVGRLALDHSCG